MSFNITYGFLIIVSYILGSIPFGLLIAKFACKVDIMSAGSKNIGATNVTRVCGKWAGITTFLLDAIKGIVIVILARIYMPIPHTIEILVCFFAILGHAFSPYLKFKGGKAVATSFACIALLYPAITINIALFWLLAMVLFNTVGIASVVSSLVLCLSAVNLAIFSKNFVDTSFLFTIALLIIFKHISNIKEIRSKLRAVTQNKS